MQVRLAPCSVHTSNVARPCLTTAHTCSTVTLRKPFFYCYCNHTHECNFAHLCVVCLLLTQFLSVSDVIHSHRTRMERENQDLALEQIRLKAAEQRVTVLESIKWATAMEGRFKEETVKKCLPPTVIETAFLVNDGVVHLACSNEFKMTSVPF